MRLTYDARANAAYLYLAEGVKVASTERLDDNTVVDFDSSGEPIGIEFLAVERLAKRPWRKRR